VAINRPSFQVSTYSDYYGHHYTPNLANDGSKNTILLDVATGPHCAHSLIAPNPWWAVDLGVSLSVKEIFFTNRQEATTGEFTLGSIQISFKFRCRNKLLNIGVRDGEGKGTEEGEGRCPHPKKSENIFRAIII